MSNTEHVNTDVCTMCPLMKLVIKGDKFTVSVTKLQRGVKFSFFDKDVCIVFSLVFR